MFYFHLLHSSCTSSFGGPMAGEATGTGLEPLAHCTALQWPTTVSRDCDSRLSGLSTVLTPSQWQCSDSDSSATTVLLHYYILCSASDESDLLGESAADSECHTATLPLAVLITSVIDSPECCTQPALLPVPAPTQCHCQWPGPASLTDDECVSATQYWQ
jgi:hypothetical protein